LTEHSTLNSVSLPLKFYKDNGLLELCYNLVLVKKLKKSKEERERVGRFKTVPHIGYNKPPSIGFKKLEPKRREVFC